MQQGTHASIGAWTLGPAPPAQAWGDAFRSIELVGTTTSIATVGTAGDEPWDQVPDDVIEAARAWLCDPARRRRIPAEVLASAEASLDVAAMHMRELDLLAGEVAQEANDSGAIDPLRLDRVEIMASVLRGYAERMRTLLDPDTIRAEEAAQRLRAGLEAATGGGGLPAFVAAL